MDYKEKAKEMGVISEQLRKEMDKAFVKMMNNKMKNIEDWMKENGVTEENAHEYTVIEDSKQYRPLKAYDEKNPINYKETYHLGKAKVKNPSHIKDYEIISTLEINYKG